MKSVYLFFSSLKLTVVLLALSIILVFFGTLDQVNWGIHQAQKLYFESIFVVWPYREAGYSLQQPGLPMPGGYTLGALLLINLVLGFFRFMKISWKKSGIMLIHGGIVLLLVSGFMISAWQKEGQMRIDENGKNNFSLDPMSNEIVLIDKSAADFDSVTSIPESLLEDGTSFDTPSGITIDVIDYMENTSIGRLADNPGSKPLDVTQGAAAKMGLFADEKKPDYSTNGINTASAVIRLKTSEGEIGSWLVSNLFDERFPPQKFEHNGKPYEIAMRFTRTYYPFWIELLDFTHDRYPGTNIPKNFSSQVNVVDMETNEKRQALIYMNHPLRYAGLTFFQSGFDNNDTTTILQIVRNPVWTLPYWAVLLVGVGMTVQFIIAILNFSKKAQRKQGQTQSA